MTKVTFMRFGKSIFALLIVMMALASVSANAVDRGEGPKVSATRVAIGSPGAVAVDRFGAVYFSSPNLVMKLDTQGFLSRVAGSDAAGNTGDGGPATEALLSFPAIYPELQQDPIDFGELVAGLAVDDTGNLYIADAYNNQLRRVDTNGIITTVLPPDGNLGKWPQGVATDSAGNLYISYAYGTLLKRAADGAVTQLAAEDCGRDLVPGLCVPEQIAVDANGNIYVPDGYCRVRKVAPNRDIVTIAGYEGSGNSTWRCGYAGDGGPATSAYLSNMPFGVTVDTKGNVFIADTYNHCIRRVDGEGVISTFAGKCGSAGYDGESESATAALLNRPHGVAVDAVGNVYIADTGNKVIRKVGSDGTITTIAGNGAAVSYRDASPITPVVEYYNGTLDHYFITASPAEMRALDSGRTSGWTRTGESFVAWIARASADDVSAPADLRNVCRIYIPPGLGDSHFFSASAEECAAAVWVYSDSALETDSAFLATLPNKQNGVCANGQTPVYRLWNGRADSNHRYTTSFDIRAQMVARGYTAEGYGPDGVVMCAAGNE